MIIHLKRNLIWILIPLLEISCISGDKEISDDSEYKIEFVSFNHDPDSYKITTTFKIMKDGKKVNFGNISEDNIRITESDDDKKNFPRVSDIRDIRNGKNIGDYAILILMDISNTITDDILKEEKNAIKEMLSSLPNNQIFLTTMDDKVSETRMIKDKNSKLGNEQLNLILDTIQRSEMPKYLIKAILSKLKELKGEPDKSYYPEVIPKKMLGNKDLNKMLFIFSDCQVKDSKGDFLGGTLDYARWRLDFINLQDPDSNIVKGSSSNIPIHCFYFGDKENLDDDLILQMKSLCATGGVNELKGWFYSGFNVDSLSTIVAGAIDEISADYELILSYPEDKRYQGDPIKFILEIDNGAGKKAVGKKIYGYGTKYIDKEVRWGTIFKGLLIGILLVVLVYSVLQFLVPYLRYRVFLKKYVIKFSASRLSGNTNQLVEEKCFYDKRKFDEGDLVVVKCKHTVHLECWEENRNRCPEYGSKNCSTGIHYYNRKQLTDIRNAPHYLPWVLYGLTSGIISWFFLKLFITWDLFNMMTVGLVKLFYPLTHTIDPKAGIDHGILSQFQLKLEVFQLSGLILGFFLTLFFSYFIEFRKKTLKVVNRMLLRSLIGCVTGFTAFLIGNIIIILSGKYLNSLLVDWIPWAFFALLISIVLAVRTEIKLRNALLGGLISVLFSFIFLYLSNINSEVMGMLSYMVYAAGLGTSIAAVHFISEKFFLRAEGFMKPRDIAIYKWMNVGGGFNKVTIGKSIDCLIQINWDEQGIVADKQAELFLENDRPYCRALEDGMKFEGKLLKKGEVIHLMHGDTLGIGNSTFTYIEKDK